jgi:hypothetical protein
VCVSVCVCVCLCVCVLPSACDNSYSTSSRHLDRCGHPFLLLRHAASEDRCYYTEYNALHRQMRSIAKQLTTSLRNVTSAAREQQRDGIMSKWRPGVCVCVCVCVCMCVCVCVYVCYPLPATTAAPRARDISTGVALHFCSSDMLQVRIDVITQNTKCVCVGGSVCLVTCVSLFFRPEQNQLSRQFLQDVCGGKCN